MNRLSILSLAAVLALSAPPAIAQQAAAPTAISRVTLYRIPAGQRPAFDKDMKENIFPIWEAQKKAGIIVSYAVFTKTTRDGENDWQVGTTVTYANWGALDGIGAKTDPITLKHYGSAERRTAAGDARNTFRVAVSAHWLGSYAP